MKKEIASIKFEDSILLKEVVEKYNWRYGKTSRKCELISDELGNHKITMIDDGKLLPFGIFDIGYSIGEKWMFENYRIKLTGWYKIFDLTLFESKEYPQKEIKQIELKEKHIVDLEIKKATSPNAAIGGIKNYLEESDYGRICSLSKFKLIPNIKSKIYQTKNNLRISYSTTDNYLFIFGTDLRYGKEYYRIDLESVFEIERPNYDF